ncbi:hypothetical protein TanjilG_32139 [Lupinus angustifolius]|uniref:Uncharacterized protein n=1 Tax=Lupinus angustifolius TaxID=3871 RepID=A0A394DDI8_LUPAN|nr:hypothetical protein TanjilG_32139 [Lupinus angustifolius]
MMKNHYPRKMLPPVTSRKRKHKDSDEPAKPKASEPIQSNQLLAGYLAHEFLTNGTLFGERFNPYSTRYNTKPSSNKTEPSKSQMDSKAVGPAVNYESYGDVAYIMKTDGTHIKGIVNPTQLSQWIHM